MLGFKTGNERTPSNVPEDTEGSFSRSSMLLELTYQSKGNTEDDMRTHVKCSVSRPYGTS